MATVEGANACMDRIIVRTFEILVLFPMKTNVLLEEVIPMITTVGKKILLLA